MLPIPRFWKVTRPPLATPLGYFIAALAGHCLAAVQNLLIGMKGTPVTSSSVSLVLVWAVLSAAAYGIALAGHPLWTRLQRGGWGLDRPTWGSWLAYCAVFSATGLAGGAVRSSLALALFPTVLLGKSAVGFAINVVIANLSTALCLQILSVYSMRQLEHNEAHRRLAGALARSRAEVVETDDRLRRELAELLHGKVQSNLVAAWALLGQASAKLDAPGAAAQPLGLAVRCVEDVRRDALARVRDLLAPAQGSALARLKEQVARFEPLLPVRWMPDAAYTAQEPSVDPRTALLAARMLEEALLNAFRHARARRVVVRVGPDAKGHLQIEVKDDGVGFRLDAASRGLGLSGLGAGLEEQGGRLEVQSAPGQGTRVTITVPTLEQALDQPREIAA